MEGVVQTYIAIPKKVWEEIVARLEQIQCSLDKMVPPAEQSHFITAKEFMDTVKIRRTKFDRLVAEGRIRILKKKRKIYVERSQVEKYFKDPET